MKRKTTFLTKALTLLFVMLFTLTGARAAETLTVYDGSTTNSVVPIWGANLGYTGSWGIGGQNRYSKSQFIIPAAELEDMIGGDITVMTFYTEQTEITWYGDIAFEVYLSEVSANTISSLQNWSSMTQVYSGGLGVGSNMMTIPLNSPFKYNGGNLLVGIRQTARGTSALESTWYGETVEGASVGGYTNNASTNTGNNISQQNFIPKTTFTFLPGHTPTNVTISNITTTTADVSWTGNADSYIVKYRRKRDGFFEEFSSSIPSTWTIRNANSYGWAWSNELGDGMASSWSWDSSAGAQYADNWLISPAVELGGTLKFDVLVAQWHDSYEVLLSTTGIAEADFTETLQKKAPGITGTVDIDLADYSGEGYIAIHHMDHDQFYLDIDNFEVTPGHDWTTIERTATQKSVQLTSLIPGAEYELVIIGIKNGYEAHTPNTSFTTVDGPIQVTIGKHGYTSLYYGDRALTIPSNVTAYTYRISNGELVVSRTYSAGQTLPKGTAVVLQGAQGTYSFERSNQSGTVDNNNVLRGTDVKLETTGGKYYYAFTTLNDANPGFYWRNPGGKPFKNNPNKAYLALDEKITQSADTEVKSFFLLPEDDPTGIDNVNDNLNDEAIYNLAGQRIGKMQKGINIVNGKKILK